MICVNWRARLGDDKVNSYLEDLEVGEARHEGACRLCGEPTTMDHALHLDLGVGP